VAQEQKGGSWVPNHPVAAFFVAHARRSRQRKPAQNGLKDRDAADNALRYLCFGTYFLTLR